MSLSRKMHITIALAMALTMTLTMGVEAWYLRGAYDDVMINVGDFRVVNASDQELDIVLRFPSGAIRSCKLGDRARPNHSCARYRRGFNSSDREPEEVETLRLCYLPQFIVRIDRENRYGISYLSMSTNALPNKTLERTQLRRATQL